jgi:hypothetical protein
MVAFDSVVLILVLVLKVPIDYYIFRHIWLILYRLERVGSGLLAGLMNNVHVERRNLDRIL